ncbi:MAG: PAS domain S-box protein, partial [Proteobacteria bacterium]|nr:PAS domain S-box protein [Pseudomonadota bacterium]
MFVPVYRRGLPSDTLETRREHLQGFVLGVFRVGDLVEKSLADIQPAGINYFLYDMSAPEGERYLYSHQSRLSKKNITQEIEKNPVSNQLFQYAKTLNVAGREWMIVFTATPDFLASRRSWQPWGILFIGLLLNGLIAGYFLSNLRNMRLLSDMNTQLLDEIEERNRMNETLQKRETQFNEMGRIAKVGGWEFDVETQEQVWTEEVYRIHEVDMTYKPMVSKGIDFYALASRPIIERSVQRAIEYGEPFDVELELITAKGNHRWVHVIGKVHQEYGKTKKVSGVFQDITERKQIEATLRESEQKFRTLFEDSRDAIYITTKEGRFIDFNQAYLELFRYTKEEMITLLAKDTYMNLSDRDMFKKTIEEKGSVRDYEAKLRRKDGQQMDCIITATTRYADDGSISGYQGIIKDITERKELEEQLQVVSLTDELTVLYNRRGFFTLAQQQMKVAERTKKDMLLFFADLDKMKQINDTLGHQEGDKALIEVAAILKEVFRESDIIGRM